jgi:CheY-like chemotaxis protein/anti-sigma regulatory factor (Ser/Thr protein kinase)
LRAPGESDWTKPDSTIEATILVVDDNPVDRRLAGAIVEKRLSWQAIYACDGLEALPLLERDPPSVVLTDMLMPEMGGLELVEWMRERHPLVPVVLMTAYGSEAVAMQALQNGAASYVAKKNLPGELTETLRRVLAASNRDRRQRWLLQCLTNVESCFALENEPSLVPVLVAHLQEQLGYLRLCDEADTTRVGVALEEALLNAIYHGNLGCDADFRREAGEAWRHAAWKLCDQPPYRDRRVIVRARVTADEAEFVIGDDGPGFDPSRLPNPADPASIDTGGRGLLLIRTFMDEVRFNAAGNEITLIKRRRHGREDAECAS